MYDAPLDTKTVADMEIPFKLSFFFHNYPTVTISDIKEKRESNLC